MIKKLLVNKEISWLNLSSNYNCQSAFSGEVILTQCVTPSVVVFFKSISYLTSHPGAVNAQSGDNKLFITDVHTVTITGQSDRHT